MSERNELAELLAILDSLRGPGIDPSITFFPDGSGYIAAGAGTELSFDNTEEALQLINNITVPPTPGTMDRVWELFNRLSAGHELRISPVMSGSIITPGGICYYFWNIQGALGWIIHLLSRDAQYWLP